MADLHQFELNFTYRGPDGELVEFTKLADNSLVSLLAQFQLVLGRTAQKMRQLAEQGKYEDDDIPF